MKVFPSTEGYRKSDLTDGGCRCTKDYVVEQNLIGAQC
jgi:hypothetical protein